MPSANVPEHPVHKPLIGLIWAQSRGGVMGKDGGMPWHLPEDLAHFKRTTLHWPVIMGRKTWESIPAQFRPLPERTNIVLTRQADWRAAGALHTASLEDALRACVDAKRAWVIGGAQIFQAALPLASELVVTEIDADFSGDTYAPAIGLEWRRVARESCQAANGLRLDFVVWRRVHDTKR